MSATVFNRLLRDHDGLLAGTVHVAQGKERDVVLFVLGGNPDRPVPLPGRPGRPNLINVAVSRAKQRL